jgi:hypothetical protein
MKKMIPAPPFGPTYNIDSAALKKFRRVDSLGGTLEQFRKAYGEAVEKAVLAAQRSQLRRAAVPERRPNCASGTWHTTGAAIDKAIRQQHRAALLACPGQIRRARPADEWRKLYDAAMAEKRARQPEPVAKAA